MGRILTVNELLGIDKRAFVVPNNDLEAIVIIRLLKGLGENVMVTSQGWGATWANLEQDIKDKISKLSSDVKVYGIELQGDVLCDSCFNIDHHRYDNDDRSNDKSSLQQVADIINLTLNDYEQFVSINDTAYIPGMLSLDIDVTEDRRKMLIDIVRLDDRQAQGITPDEESQAIEPLARKEILNDTTCIIRSPHSKCACYTDRLFGTKFNRILIVTNGDGDVECNFYGDTRTIETLFGEFGGWTGGDLPNGSGFWGAYAPAEKVINCLKNNTEM